MKTTMKSAVATGMIALAAGASSSYAATLYSLAGNGYLFSNDQATVNAITGTSSLYNGVYLGSAAVAGSLIYDATAAAQPETVPTATAGKAYLNAWNLNGSITSNATVKNFTTPTAGTSVLNDYAYTYNSVNYENDNVSIGGVAGGFGLSTGYALSSSSLWWGQGNDEFITNENLPATLPPGSVQGTLTLTFFSTTPGADPNNQANYRVLSSYVTLTNQGQVPTPEVPVPAAAWLFGSALLGLGAVKRRKA